MHSSQKFLATQPDDILSFHLANSPRAKEKDPLLFNERFYKCIEGSVPNRPSESSLTTI